MHKSQYRQTAHLNPIGVGIFCLIGFLLIGLIINTVMDLEHYNRVSRNPLRITAVVTNHDSHTDEDDVTYYSYVAYVVNGTHYAGIQYESKNIKTKLTPIGQNVVIEVSPENPAELIQTLRSARSLADFLAFTLAFFLAFGWRCLLRSKRSRSLPGTPDQDVLQRDLRLTVYGRFFLGAWLLMTVLLGSLWWRYPTTTDKWVKYTTVGSGLLWLFCLISALRSLNAIRNQQYRLNRDVLVKKTEKYDAEDGYSYCLEFRSDDDTLWQSYVTQDQYLAMHKGSTVLAVYLPGKKHPTLHYNVHGDAE